MTLRIDSRDAYEFLLTLTAYATPYRVDSYDVGEAWFERVDGLVAPSDRETLRALTEACEHVLIRLFGLARDLPAPGSSEQLLEALAALEPDDLRLTLLGFYSRRTRRRIAPDVILAAAKGDRAAERAFLSAAPDGPECVRALTGLLTADPTALRDSMVVAMRGWDRTVFREHISLVGPLIEMEVDRLRRRAEELDEHDFLVEATNGSEVITEHGMESIELFPHWALRPWNVFWEHGTAQMIGVPIPAEHASVNPEDPPDRLVSLAKALGDERRLRILRRLTAGPASLQELADHFDTPKTTLLHHLVILRTAGIVRLGPGTSPRYSLRTEMPLELHRLLDGYLPAVPRSRDGTASPSSGTR